MDTQAERVDEEWAGGCQWAMICKSIRLDAVLKSRGKIKHHCDRVVLHATTRHAIEGEKKLYKETKKTHGTSTRGAWDVKRRSLG